MNINCTHTHAHTHELTPSIPMNTLFLTTFFPLCAYFSTSPYFLFTGCMLACVITSYDTILVAIVVVSFSGFFFFCFFSICVIWWNQFRLLVFRGRRVQQQIYFGFDLTEITDIDKRLKNCFFPSLLRSIQFIHNDDG